jgi:hypothetical protein
MKESVARVNEESNAIRVMTIVISPTMVFLVIALFVTCFPKTTKKIT